MSEAITPTAGQPNRLPVILKALDDTPFTGVEFDDAALTIEYKPLGGTIQTFAPEAENWEEAGRGTFNVLFTADECSAPGLFLYWASYTGARVYEGAVWLKDPGAAPDAGTGATFDPALPTKRDHIRLAIGDTDVTAPMLGDDTITAKLALFSYPEALAQCAEALISLVGQQPDSFSESGGVSLKWGSRIEAWQRVIESARAGNIATPGARRKARTIGAIGVMQPNIPDSGFRSW